MIHQLTGGHGKVSQKACLCVGLHIKNGIVQKRNMRCYLLCWYNSQLATKQLNGVESGWLTRLAQYTRIVLTNSRRAKHSHRHRLLGIECKVVWPKGGGDFGVGRPQCTISPGFPSLTLV